MVLVIVVGFMLGFGGCDAGGISGGNCIADTAAAVVIVSVGTILRVLVPKTYILIVKSV